MPSPTYFFLDTEWADANGTALVSLALVSEDGTREFYAEREVLPEHPTDFVREQVYPLLDRGDAIFSDQAMTTALRAFFKGVELPYVLADFPNDLKLFHCVLDGFDDVSSGPKHRTPAVVTTLMDRDPRMTRLLERWFAMHPDDAARRHHALVDARALRMAWLAATERQHSAWNGE